MRDVSTSLDMTVELGTMADLLLRAQAVDAQ